MRSRIVIIVSSFTLALALLVGLAPTGASSASSRVTTGKSISKLSIAVVANAVDSADPAWGGSSLVLETTMPLLSYYPRVNGKVGALAPGLATAIPKPTNHGMTYVFHLKPGIKYSNGQPVLASDFQYAIERLYLANDYPIGKFYLIKGAAAFGKTRKGSIAGIIPDNASRTITFQLTAPMPTFDMLMAQYFTAPEPASTPAAAQDNQVPSTGPMMVTHFIASQGYTLVKNPYFMPTAAMPASNVNEIVATVVSNPNVALSQTLNGTYNYDDENVAPDQLGTLLSKNASQTVTVALAATNMFSLNVTLKPFNDLRVRQAVNYAINRTAMASLLGGLQLPTQNILPPGETSFRKISAYPYNLAKAKSLVQAAHATGYKVTILASGDPTSEPEAVYLDNQLNAIGLNASVNIVPPSTFFGVPSNPKTDPQISWFPWNELIPDASDWIGQLFNGQLINYSHNEDWSMFNVASINKQIATAEALPLGSARDAAWAALDRALVVNYAAVVPYGNPVQVFVFSKSINTHCFTTFVGGEALLSNFCSK